MTIRELLERLKFAHGKALELVAQCEQVNFTIKQLVGTSKSPEEQAILKQMKAHAAGLCQEASQLKALHKKRSLEY